MAHSDILIFGVFCILIISCQINEKNVTLENLMLKKYEFNKLFWIYLIYVKDKIKIDF